MLVFPDLYRHQAVAVLERIRTIFFYTERAAPPLYTASFGVTDSTRGETLDELVRLADIGLYAAKEAGRDRITISETLPTGPGLTVVSEKPSDADEKQRPRRARPAFHEAANEDDPHVSGL